MTFINAATATGLHHGNTHAWKCPALASRNPTHIPITFHIENQEKFMNEKTDTEIDTEATDIPMRILRVATCPSLSGRSELTYHVGCNEAGSIHFRLWGNTAAGMFSNTWFSMLEVSKLLSVPDGLTSSALKPLWNLTSRNNPGFTMALLQGEGLIEKSLDTRGTYKTANAAPFLERTQRLIASGVELSEDDEPSENLPIAAAEAPKRGRHKKQPA